MYGVDRFLDNFAEMDVKLGRMTRLYWKVIYRAGRPCSISRQSTNCRRLKKIGKSRVAAKVNKIAQWRVA